MRRQYNQIGLSKETTEFKEISLKGYLQIIKDKTIILKYPSIDII